MERINRVKGIKKQTDNPFLNLYEFEAERRNGKVAPYYMVSRNTNSGQLKAVTHENEPNGVVIYAVYGENKDKLV